MKTRCVILFLSICYLGYLRAQDSIVYNFQGLMGERTPVRVLLERKGNQVQGLLLDIERKILYGMEGTITGNTLDMLAGSLHSEPSLQDAMEGFILPNHTRAGRFQAQLLSPESLEGEWTAFARMATIPGSTTFRLQKRDFEVKDPFQTRQELNGQTNPAEFAYGLSERLTGVDFSLLYFFGKGPRVLSENGLLFDILIRNLFGDSNEEVLLHLNFEDGLHLLAAYEKNGDAVRRVPGYIALKKPEAGAGPCMIKAPGAGYFFYSFEEVYAPGEYALLGNTYGGKCEGLERGDNVHFYLWRFQPDGVKLVYSDIQDFYQYESPDPKAVKPPVSNTFTLVEGAKRAYPKRIKKASHAVDPKGVRMDQGEAKVEYIELD